MQGRDGAERATSTCNASSWRRMTVSIQSSGGIQGGDVLGSYGQIVREIRATDISWVFSPWTSLMRTIVQMVMLIPGVLKKKKSFKPRQKKLRKNLRSCSKCTCRSKTRNAVFGSTSCNILPLTFAFWYGSSILLYTFFWALNTEERTTPSIALFLCGAKDATLR
jgi:hypothetical protein